MIKRQDPSHDPKKEGFAKSHTYTPNTEAEDIDPLDTIDRLFAAQAIKAMVTMYAEADDRMLDAMNTTADYFFQLHPDDTDVHDKVKRLIDITRQGHEIASEQY